MSTKPFQMALEQHRISSAVTRRQRLSGIGRLSALPKKSGLLIHQER